MVNPQTGLPDPAGGPSTSPPRRRRLGDRLRLGIAGLVLRVGGSRGPSRRGRLTRGPRLRRGSAGRLRRGPAVRDLLDEALAGVAARPTRLILTTLGTVLGIAALVGTLGLGQTAAGQITQRFDLAAATRVVVQPED